jgi:hypothetical protein
MRIHRAFNLLAGALVLAGVLAPIASPCSCWPGWATAPPARGCWAGADRANGHGAAHISASDESPRAGTSPGAHRRVPLGTRT